MTGLAFETRAQDGLSIAARTNGVYMDHRLGGGRVGHQKPNWTTSFAQGAKIHSGVQTIFFDEYYCAHTLARQRQTTPWQLGCSIYTDKNPNNYQIKS